MKKLPKCESINILLIFWEEREAEWGLLLWAAAALTYSSLTPNTKPPLVLQFQ
jgi:hypothetical protein